MNTKKKNKSMFNFMVVLATFITTIITVGVLGFVVYIYRNKKEELKNLIVKDKSPVVFAKESISKPICSEYKDIKELTVNVKYKVPQEAQKLTELPLDLQSLYEEESLNYGSLYEIKCDNIVGYLFIYKFDKTGLEKGYFDIEIEENKFSLDNEDQKVNNFNSYYWKSNLYDQPEYIFLKKDLFFTGEKGIRASLIAKEENIKKFKEIFAEIIENVEYIEEPIINNDLVKYTNPAYGYSFDYSSEDVLEEVSGFYCKDYKCLKSETNGDVVKINDLYITSYASNVSTDYDYDEGLDKNLYKEPIKTSIGGEAYYYIISNDGYIRMITHDYKISGDILWVKTEKKVVKKGISYYISFNSGLFDDYITEVEIENLNKLFNLFVF